MKPIRRFRTLVRAERAFKFLGYSNNSIITIGYKVVGDYEGSKVKIQNAFIIRQEFQRALELNPNDATTTCLLGQWWDVMLLYFVAFDNSSSRL